jgi:phenylalanine-4-hydroxylase
VFSPLKVGHAGGIDRIVRLDPDHPGFRDLDYRRRRDGIAQLALAYRSGAALPVAEYIEDEHAVWRTVWAGLEPLHARWAALAYRESANLLPLSHARIPQLGEVDTRLAGLGGLRLMPVAGLISAREFLEYLQRGIFLSTQYIRHYSSPLYTPEPDVVHELVGHASTLAHPDYIRLNRAFGAAACDADAERLVRLERVYWYTLEFGAVREADGVKAFGAGLLSSSGELERFATQAQHLPFDLAAMAARPYDPTTYQPVIFVAPSWDAVMELTTRLAAV